MLRNGKHFCLGSEALKLQVCGDASISECKLLKYGTRPDSVVLQDDI